MANKRYFEKLYGQKNVKFFFEIYGQKKIFYGQKKMQPIYIYGLRTSALYIPSVQYYNGEII